METKYFISYFINRIEGIVTSDNLISTDKFFKNENMYKQFISKNKPEIYTENAIPVFIDYAKYNYIQTNQHWIWNLPEHIEKYKDLDIPISREENLLYTFSQIRDMINNKYFEDLISFVEYDEDNIKYITIIYLTIKCAIRFKITTMKKLLSLFYKDKDAIKCLFNKKEQETHIFFTKIHELTITQQINYLNKNLNITDKNISKDLKFILNELNIVLHDDFNTFYLTSII